MKIKIALLLMCALISAASHAQLQQPMDLPPDSALNKSLVINEVEKREHVNVISVQIVKPGLAEAVFERGTATVHFGFNDPIANCPLGKERECEKIAHNNPLGFKILSYESHRSQ